MDYKEKWDEHARYFLKKRGRNAEIVELFEDQDVKLIIQKRFVKCVDDSKYAEYAGSIYPMGMDNNDRRMFIFTNKDIKEVVFIGYQNREEEVYVVLMKKKLIIDNELTSLSYQLNEGEQWIKYIIKER